MYEFQYSDSSCSILSATISLASDYTTCYNVEETTASAVSSYQGFCYLGSEVLAPMDSFMHSYYNSASCDAAPVQYSLYATELCADVTGLYDNKYSESYYSTCSSTCKFISIDLYKTTYNKLCLYEWIFSFLRCKCDHQGLL